MARRNLPRRIFVWTLGIGIAFVALCGVLYFWIAPRVFWNMRYGNGIARHQATLDIARRATQIDDIPSTLPIEKYFVRQSRVALGESTPRYVVMLKYCRPGRDLEYALIAWADETLMVRRYLHVQQWGKSQKPDPPTGTLTVPVSIEAFSQAAAAQGFTKCCHAALLDIEARWYGIPAYDVPSALYYEARLSGDLWLYWEADRAGTILAHGVHNSP
jgi:hypothetical protein